MMRIQDSNPCILREWECEQIFKGIVCQENKIKDNMMQVEINKSNGDSSKKSPLSIKLYKSEADPDFEKLKK